MKTKTIVFLAAAAAVCLHATPSFLLQERIYATPGPGIGCNANSSIIFELFTHNRYAYEALSTMGMAQVEQ